MYESEAEEHNQTQQSLTFMFNVKMCPFYFATFMKLVIIIIIVSEPVKPTN